MRRPLYKTLVGISSVCGIYLERLEAPRQRGELQELLLLQQQQ